MLPYVGVVASFLIITIVCGIIVNNTPHEIDDKLSHWFPWYKSNEWMKKEKNIRTIRACMYIIIVLCAAYILISFGMWSFDKFCHTPAPSIKAKTEQPIIALPIKQQEAKVSVPGKRDLDERKIVIKINNTEIRYGSKNPIVHQSDGNGLAVFVVNGNLKTLTIRAVGLSVDEMGFLQDEYNPGNDDFRIKDYSDVVWLSPHKLPKVVANSDLSDKNPSYEEIGVAYLKAFDQLKTGKRKGWIKFKSDENHEITRRFIFDGN